MIGVTPIKFLELSARNGPLGRTKVKE